MAKNKGLTTAVLRKAVQKAKNEEKKLERAGFKDIVFTPFGFMRCNLKKKRALLCVK